MQIRVINPNTTAGMTASIGAAARAVSASGTEIIAVNPSFGAPSIECHHDDVWAAAGVTEQVRRGEAEGADAYVIACFGDPGLKAARELARGPVVGIAEAAMHLASMIGSRFSVVTTLGRTMGQAWHLAEIYGMERFCANVRACELPVLELEEPGSGARERIVDECRRALEEDGSDCIVLGCAGMTDLCAHIEQVLAVPVIDGVAAGTKLIESLVALKLRTSKRGELAKPLPKPIIGALEGFTLPR